MTDPDPRLLRAAVKAAANAMILTDRQGTILWVNPAFTRITGYAAEEAIGQTPHILASGHHDRSFYETLWATIMAGHVWQGEIVNRRRDGTLYPEFMTITPVQDADGDITHFVAIKQDLSQQRAIEDTLVRQRELFYQSEKLAAMGQLLAGVAHELNNPLAVLLGQAFLLQQAGADAAFPRRVDQITRAAERCARIVKNFLALARESPPERAQVSLNDLVTQAVELLAYPLRVDTVEVVLELAPELPTLWADPHQLQQVLVNLIANAHQAMRETAPPRRLTLRTRVVPQPPAVQLTVEDTGPGVPPHLQDRIFEPFFTTKPLGQGTGLGLSLCRGIILDHHGTMGVERVPGAGARFWVVLPLESPPGTRAPAASRAAGARRPSRAAHVLVVDDEPDVRSSVSEMLGQMGHVVAEAANGRAALQQLAAPGAHYDVVLCDTRMPELDGAGLYATLEAAGSPCLERFVFLTGDGLSADARALFERTHRRVLHKPFTPGQLLDTIAQVLGLD